MACDLRQATNPAGESACTAEHFNTAGTEQTAGRHKAAGVVDGPSVSRPEAVARDRWTLGDYMGGLVAAHQPIYTAHGPLPARELVGRDALPMWVCSHALGRMAAHMGWVIEVDVGPLCSIVADGDLFIVAPTGVLELAHGGRIPVNKLRLGDRVCAGTAYNADGSVRIILRDGNKGKETWHRLIACDVVGVDIEGKIIHHGDGNKLNNATSNLEPLDGQSEHTTIHVRELLEQGIHPFQLNTYPKRGAANGMHRDSAFWKDADEVKRYREKQRRIALDRSPRPRTSREDRRRMLDMGHRVRNAGHVFKTMDEYIDAHKHVFGRIGSRKKKAGWICRLFGSIEGFIAALDSENYKVESVEFIGNQQRYAVVMSAAGGHPLRTPPVVIWPIGNTSPFGAGLALHT